MLNVNKITSTLARMPDQQLQQYAQVNKNDPYIMALALSESNRRKEIRSAGQGTQGEQPKVVDQMLAEMAPRPAQPMPEDQGIGQLPAGNMNFAGGGIIAFADGGDVERYNGMAGSLTGDIPGFVAGTGNFIPQAGAPEEVPLFRRLYREAQEKGKNYQLEQAKARIAAGVGTSADRAILAAAQPEQNNAPSPQDLAQFDAASNLYMTERANKQAATALKAANAAPPADTTKLSLSGGPAIKPAAPVVRPETGPTDIDALQQKYFGAIDQEVGGLRNARAGLVAGIKDLAEQNLTATKAGIEARGDVFKSREERLSAREKSIDGMGDKNMGLALLQAGAAMMSTPGGLGVALGKGVAVGSERYAAGLDKLNAAKDRFAEARDRLDDLRINRDDMNARDIRAAEQEARNSGLKGQELLYNGLVSDLGVKQKNVSSIFTAAASALEKDKEIASRERTTGISESGANARTKATIEAQLNTPDRLVFNQLLKNSNNDPVAAATELQKMKIEKFNVYDAYSKYLQAFAGKDTLKGPDDFDVFAKRFIPTITPGKNTTVRTQPGE